MTFNNLDGSTLSFDRDRDISFDEAEHRYSHVSGIDLESVSRVYKNYFPEFDAAYWARRKAPEMGITAEELLDRWQHTGDLASATGTFMHKQIELRINNPSTPAITTTEHHYHSKWIDTTDHIDIGVEMAYFEQFWHDRRLAPFRTEWAVFDLPSRMAGTIDLAVRTGERSIALYDWKRSNKLIDKTTGQPITTASRYHNYGIGPLDDVEDLSYWHYAMQQNLYRYIVERNYGLKVDTMSLVVLHNSLQAYHVITLPRLDDKVAAIIALRKWH